LTRLETEFKEKTILLDQSVEKIANLEHHLELAVQEIDQLKKKRDDSSTISDAHHPSIISTSPKASIPRTCYEIKSSQPGYTQGTYIIDPSGVGRDPITVFCDPDGISKKVFILILLVLNNIFVLLMRVKVKH